MKLPWILFLTILLCGCFNLFNENKNLITAYKLGASTKIVIFTQGYGATTNDFTDIRKITSDKDELIKRIDGSYSNHKAKIFRIDDTLFKVIFTDTSVFKGMSRTFTFNINDRVKIKI